MELVSIQKVPFVQLQLLDEGLIKSLEHITNLGLGIQRCINVGFKAREERIVAAILINRILHFLLAARAWDCPCRSPFSAFH